MRHAVELGADKATWSRSQFVRLPAGLRDTGARQSVFYFDPDSRSRRGGNLMEPDSEKPRPLGFANAPEVGATFPASKPPPLVEFKSPSELRAFTPPEGWNLVGDFHVQRGSPFVIGGAPGVGKSRVTTALAVAGATQADWFGLPVHHTFRTMILQAENGPVRLRDEYAMLDEPDATTSSSASAPPPPYGFAFDNPDFCVQLIAAIASFTPDVFIVDPWNRVAADDKSKDYLEAFKRILEVLPTGEKAPALGNRRAYPQARRRRAHRRTGPAERARRGLRARQRAAFGLCHPARQRRRRGKPGGVQLRQNITTVPSDRVRRGCAATGCSSPWRTLTGRSSTAPARSGASSLVTTSGPSSLPKMVRMKLCSLPRSRLSPGSPSLPTCKNAACYRALEPDGKFCALLKESGGMLTLARPTLGD